MIHVGGLYAEQQQKKRPINIFLSHLKLKIFLCSNLNSAMGICCFRIIIYSFAISLAPKITSKVCTPKGVCDNLIQ